MRLLGNMSVGRRGWVGGYARAGARGAFTSVIPSGLWSSGSGIALEVPSSRSCGNRGACSMVAIVRGFSEKLDGLDESCKCFEEGSAGDDIPHDGFQPPSFAFSQFFSGSTSAS